MKIAIDPNVGSLEFDENAPVISVVRWIAKNGCALRATPDAGLRIVRVNDPHVHAVARQVTA